MKKELWEMEFEELAEELLRASREADDLEEKFYAGEMAERDFDEERYWIQARIEATNKWMRIRVAQSETELSATVSDGRTVFLSPSGRFRVEG